MKRPIQMARRNISIMGLGLMLLWALPAFGGMEMQKDLNQLEMAMGLLGGLALFLFGKDQMAEGLKAGHGEFLIMRLLVSETSPDYVIATPHC